MTQPTVTRDLDLAKKDLGEFGYCLIADALTPEEVDACRTRLVVQADAEEEAGLAFRDGGGSNQQILDVDGNLKPDAFTTAAGGINQRLWNLVNKGQCFRDLVVHPLVDELVGHVLGDEFILSTHSANIAKPGGVRMGLHTDQWWMPQPTRPNPDYRRPSTIRRQPADEFVEPDLSLGIAPPVVLTTVTDVVGFMSFLGLAALVLL